MIIQRLFSQWWIRRKLKNSLFQPRELDLTPNQQVAILFNADHLDQQKKVMEFEKILREEIGFNTHPLGFINRKLGRKVSFGFKHISLTELDSWQLPSGKTWDLFQQRIYHIIITLNIPQSLMLDWLSFRLKSSHKIGIQPIYPNLYDIVIDPSGPDLLEDAVAKSLDIFERINL